MDLHLGFWACAATALAFLGCSSGEGGARERASAGGTSGAGGAAAGAGGTLPAGAGGGGTGGSFVDGGGGAGGAPAGEALDALSVCPGSVPELFGRDAIQPPATLSGTYEAADPSRRAALDDSIRALVARDVARAVGSAQTAAYDLCRTDEGGSLVVVWRPQVVGRGHAVFAFRAGEARPLVVEAPHAFHDVATELEATEMFVELDARALVVSGTYRCASVAAGPCDGFTTACTGIPIPYTITDAAHNSDMLFQAAHVALTESFAGDVVTSLHGMPDPGISVSNGTQVSPAPDSFQVRLLGELQVEFPGETISTCQEAATLVADRRWCGSENVQGRHVNGSLDVCSANAASTFGRFVHVEQSRAIRDQRARVIAAFGRALR